MSPVDVVLAIVFGFGASLVLAEAPWFRRRPLSDRIRPYARTGRNVVAGRGSDSSVKQILEPLLMDLGGRLSRTLGVATNLETRLRRADSALDGYGFRLRQATYALVAACLGLAVSVSLRPPAIMAVVMVAGSPLLAFLALEQQLNSRIQARQERLQAELPVVTEQMGMLLAAGYSLTSAIARLADRGSGIAASDLHRVTLEMRQGVSEAEAFERWADLSGLESVRRLVRVLALHTEAGDLGALISEEARSMRAEAHRELTAAIEKRAQLVWIPVTVATLVPGLIFLAVPFYSAMVQVTGG